MKPSGIDGAQALERLRNGGLTDLAAKLELALTFAYAEGREDEREAMGGQAPCPHCGGSGSVTVPSDNGPDPEMMDADCDHCGGKQTLLDAYAGVCQLLLARSESHMHTVGRYLAMRDALKWVMTATGEGIAGAFDTAEAVLSRLEGATWRQR